MELVHRIKIRTNHKSEIEKLVEQLISVEDMDDDKLYKEISFELSKEPFMLLVQELADSYMSKLLYSALAKLESKKTVDISDDDFNKLDSKTAKIKKELCTFNNFRKIYLDVTCDDSGLIYINFDASSMPDTAKELLNIILEETDITKGNSIEKILKEFFEVDERYCPKVTIDVNQIGDKWEIKTSYDSYIEYSMFYKITKYATRFLNIYER